MSTYGVDDEREKLRDLSLELELFRSHCEVMCSKESQSSTPFAVRLKGNKWHTSMIWDGQQDSNLQRVLLNDLRLLAIGVSTMVKVVDCWVSKVR